MPIQIGNLVLKPPKDQASMPIQYRLAVPAEDSLIAQHFYQMWRDLNIAADQIEPDWQTKTLAFITQARQTLDFKTFVATTSQDEVIGSASCQLFAGLYPLILTASQQKRGYIWGVFVEAVHRQQGIGTHLTQCCIDHLTHLGCTHALLNASPIGRPVYEALGFKPGNLMSLTLKKP